MGKSLQEMYALVGVGPFDTASVEKEEQFRLVRNSYRKKALKHHPDKGGDPEQFRLLQTAFEYLRDHVYANDAPPLPNIKTKRDDFEETYNEVAKRDVPSWEFYKEAPEESVPIYFFQYAVSKKSTCTVCRTKIDKGELRIGKLNEDYGSYGKFCKIHCFSWDAMFSFLDTFDFGKRKTWKKMQDCMESMDGLYICGFTLLRPKDKKKVATLLLHAWKSKKGTKKRAVEEQVTVSKKRKTLKQGKQEKQDAIATTSTDLTEASQEVTIPEEDKPTFVVPKVTKKNRYKLKGQTFVSTGIFPELGGGTGINIGKERLRQMIESFGGTYKDHMSKKDTTFLIEGKNKGKEKSQKAYNWQIPRMSLHELKMYIEDVANDATDVVANMEKKRYLQST